MIVVLSGTNRPGSNTRRVAGLIADLYGEFGVEPRVLDLHDLPAELFAASAYNEKPISFTDDFVEPLLVAEGLHVVTPEYNGGFPGVLKYFIDMLPFPESFEGRPVAFTGIAAGDWGGLRPVEQLQQIFGYRNAHIFPQRVFMPAIYKYFDESGAFTDAKLRNRLVEQVKCFAAFAKTFAE